MRDLKPEGASGRSGSRPNFSKLPPARWLEPPGYSAMFAEAAGSARP